MKLLVREATLARVHDTQRLITTFHASWHFVVSQSSFPTKDSMNNGIRSIIERSLRKLVHFQRGIHHISIGLPRRDQRSGNIAKSPQLRSVVRQTAQEGHVRREIPPRRRGRATGPDLPQLRDAIDDRNILPLQRPGDGDGNVLRIASRRAEDDFRSRGQMEQLGETGPLILEDLVHGGIELLASRTGELGEESRGGVVSPSGGGVARAAAAEDVGGIDRDGFDVILVGADILLDQGAIVAAESETGLKVGKSRRSGGVVCFLVEFLNFNGWFRGGSLRRGGKGSGATGASAAAGGGKCRRLLLQGMTQQIDILQSLASVHVALPFRTHGTSASFPELDNMLESMEVFVVDASVIQFLLSMRSIHWIRRRGLGHLGIRHQGTDPPLQNRHPSLAHALALHRLGAPQHRPRNRIAVVVRPLEQLPQVRLLPPARIGLHRRGIHHLARRIDAHGEPREFRVQERHARLQPVRHGHPVGAMQVHVPEHVVYPS
mmetsp:Transcript_9742/g.21131  ORF Transcript_9742/g.21131 Transcript_9742/m.21131 type:complete len:490 (-) Transcript_9742:331-1800(-)